MDRILLTVGILMVAGLTSIPVQLYAGDSPHSTLQAVGFRATGTVTDQDGEPLIGAFVREKNNPANVAVTDIDGRYSIDVAKAGATLEITYVGYDAAQVKAGDSVMTVLNSATNALDEVVVVGFGTQKKVNLTGSVSVADKKALESRPVTTAAQALQGVVPGLNISQSQGDLETNPSINIRGTGTIGQGSSGSPLILIDGMEGDINIINPQDIESISVLKDAAASSIYGSRAPFGVILVTTKKGSEGKATINYNNSFRLSSLMNLAKSMDSYTFATYFNDAAYNSPGTGAPFSADQLQRIKDFRDGKITTTTIPNASGMWGDYYYSNDNVDWVDTMFKDSNFSQEHNLSISGGTENINYYMSGNFLSQPGMVDWGKEGLKRYALTGKFSTQLFSWLRVGYSGRWTRINHERPSLLRDSDFYANLLRQGWPTLPLYDPNGYLFSAPSPVLGIEQGGQSNKENDNYYHQLSAIITPLQGWQINLEFNYHTQSQMTHWDIQKTYNHDVEGRPYEYTSSSHVHEDYYKENFLNFNAFTSYDRTIAEKNMFHVMAGFQTENMKQTAFGLQRDGIMVPSLPQVDLTTGKGPDGSDITPSVNGSRNEWDNAGFFGRINYNYDGRYLVEGNIRYDGTSRFRQNRRWIWLPSASIGWNIARESFWSDYINACNQLKLRASYGILGNQNTTNWYQTYRVLGIGIGNGSWLQNGAMTNTVGFPGLVSEALTWEKVYSWNFGLDFGLFNNRLTGSLEYFIRNTKDMVGPAPELPATLGSSAPVTNNTELRSTGWDLEIAWNDRTSFGLNYGIRAVMSDYRRKITKYTNNPTNSLSNYITGEYLGQIWGYQTIGIAKTDEEMDNYLANVDQSAIGSNWAAGDIMYRDVNGDGKIDSGASTLADHGDLTVIGNNTPRYQFSLDLTGEYKGFDLRLYFQGVMKRDYWQGSNYFWGAHGDLWHSTGLIQHLDYFRPEPSNDLDENLDSYYPRPIFNSDKNKQTQTRYLQDASYIRLKNLQVGYTLPAKITRKASIQKLRMYFSGENLWTGTHLSKLFDPETIGSGWGGLTYPLQRTYSFGFSITL